MTNRFDNLEFDDPEHSPKPKSAEEATRENVAPKLPPTGTPIRDAAWFRVQGDADYRVDNLESALRNYSRALEQDSAMYDGWFGQVRVLLENGELKEADLWSNKALELFPKQAELLALKAVASVRMGKRAIALAQSDNALSQPGTTPFVWLARAEILLASHRPMADHCLAKAVELCAGQTVARAWTLWEISRTLRRYKHAAKALRAIRQATTLIPDEPGLWMEQARCQIDLGVPAREALQQAAQLAPENLVIRKMLKSYREPGFLRRMFSIFRR